MKPGYLVFTLGCRTNQFESDCLARDLEAAGLTASGPEGPAELVVVNTCTVTARADKQSRQLIRRLARSHPQATLAVTGCLAQLEPESLASMAGVSLIVGHSLQAELARLVKEGRRGLFVGPPARRFSGFGPVPPRKRSRALLKVQDGCDGVCAYCRVRLARGPSRSLPPERVLAAAEELKRAGFAEIVLTGTHLGGYGQDADEPTDLAALMEGLLASGEGPRLRLSSLDPHEVSPQLLRVAAAAYGEGGRFCPHFHLPLQSGDAGLLQSMKRPYDPDQLTETIRSIRRFFPTAAIGADIMVGLPGEDEAAFQRTRRLIEDLPLAYLHVFPFSPRPGTLAARLPLRPAPALVSDRARKMRELSRLKKDAFLAQGVGQPTEIIVESRRDKKTGLLTGISPNYLPVLVDGPDTLFHRPLKVVGQRVVGGRLLAKKAK